MKSLIKRLPGVKQLIRWQKRHYPFVTAAYKYRQGSGRWPDMDHPRDFNEKILRYIYHDCDMSLITTLADKYRVRAYLEERGYGHLLVPLLGVWQRGDDIDFASLPDGYVMKVNNGSGSVAIVERAADADTDAIRRRMDRDLRAQYWAEAGEIQYRDIPPVIIAERLLPADNPASSTVIDYKWYCVHGEPVFCMVCLNRTVETHERDNAFYSSAWERCDERWAADYLKLYGGEVPPPATLEQMVETCRALGAQFPFVRMDFYESEGRLYFGEFTFTPNAFRSLALRREAFDYLGSLM